MTEEQEQDVPPMVPPVIRRLDEAVVNRIAAGEVIQRPASAIKELLENSIDAGATSISVTVKDGGLKLIQISDNGHGIRYEDLPILCERHTTSKLSTYEDLQNIKTLGFRGEALASMTFVAHLTVTTMTDGQSHGYKACYKDGTMDGEPRPCAAVKGTQILVENLFYNVAARRKAFKNPNEEYGRVLDVMSRYAVHKAGTSFTCKKYGETRADVHTLGTTSKVDAIKAVYGPGVARELIPISASDDDPSRSIFNMDGFISSANYSAKKTTMVLFINDRLVDCSSLKKAIEIVYAAILPKASKPFLYLSIEIPPEHVDVNVHPTKREVSFLNQESLIESVQKAVEMKLLHSNTTKTFYTQTVLPGAHIIADDEHVQAQNTTPVPGTQSQKVPVNKLVRTDSLNPAGRLHAFLPKRVHPDTDNGAGLAETRRIVRQRRNPKASADLTSVQDLLASIDRETHSGLWDIIKHCIFVGMADDDLALVQYKTKLYLLNCLSLSKELVYQQALRRFAHFNALRLSNPAPLYDVMMMALEEEERRGRLDETDGSKEKIAKLNMDIIMCKAQMLREYFAMDIDENGNICTLPLVLDQYMPNMDHFPEFVLSLGNDVDWDTEKECFETFAAALADFYAVHAPALPRPVNEGLKFYQVENKKGCVEKQDALEEGPENKKEGEMELDEELLASAENAWAQREWMIQHVLFPAMKFFLKPPVRMANDGTTIQVACLENLYKIFERC